MALEIIRGYNRIISEQNNLKKNINEKSLAANTIDELRQLIIKEQETNFNPSVDEGFIELIKKKCLIYTKNT